MPRRLDAKRIAALAFSLVAILGLSLSDHAAAEEYSDSKLRSFVVAWTNINQLADRWKPEVEAATTADQRAELLQQFEAEVSEVIHGTDGIGPGEIETIMQEAESDPELKERILAMLEEVQPR